MGGEKSSSQLFEVWCPSGIDTWGDTVNNLTTSTTGLNTFLIGLWMTVNALEGRAATQRYPDKQQGAS